MGRAGWTVAGIFLLLALLTRNSLIFTIAWILVLLGVVVWLWSRYSLSEVTYVRRIGKDRLFFGEETDLRLEVTNAKPLPLAWLRVEDEIPAAVELDPDDRASHYLPGRRLLINLFSLGLYERVTRRYKIRGVQRGAWAFGPANLICGDIFGFRSQRKELPETQVVLVFPRMYTLPELQIRARSPFGDYATDNRLADDPLRLIGVREYLPGDNFRHIHWKATARRQELQTKLFEPSASRPMAIFVNIRTYQRRLEGVNPELREFAISVGASLARWAHLRGDPVGVSVNSLMYTGGRLRVPVSKRPQQLMRILEALAYCISAPHTSIERVLQAESDRLPYGCSIVVVSATLTAELGRVLVGLARRGFAVTLLGIGGLTLDKALPGVAFQQIPDLFLEGDEEAATESAASPDEEASAQPQARETMPS